MSEAVDLELKEFEQAVMADGNVVLLFHEEGCPACARFRPIFDDGARLREGIPFVKAETGWFMDEAMARGIQGVPTVIVYRDGDEVARTMGVMSPIEFEQFLDKNLDV